jgi:hypothetical protein
LYDSLSDIVFIKKINTIIYLGILILTYQDFWILKTTNAIATIAIKQNSKAIAISIDSANPIDARVVKLVNPFL